MAGRIVCGTRELPEEYNDADENNSDRKGLAKGYFFFETSKGKERDEEVAEGLDAADFLDLDAVAHGKDIDKEGEAHEGVAAEDPEIQILTNMGGPLDGCSLF